MGGKYPPNRFHCPGDSEGAFKRRAGGNAALLDSLPSFPADGSWSSWAPDPGDWVAWENFSGPLPDCYRVGLQYNELQ